jgi:beta-lactam-binding protein with PASTA domain
VATSTTGADRGSIFLSYRRGDTRHLAGRLYDRLAQRLGIEHIFMDVDSIEPGADFAAAIDTAVASCDVLIVLIGADWLNAQDEHGERRLDDQDDFVVLEITAALKKNICILPVLVDGAFHPRRQDLPDALIPLAHRNAIRVNHETFRTDVEALLDAVTTLLESVRTARRCAERSPRGNGRAYTSAAGRRAIGVAAAVVVSLLSLVGFLVFAGSLGLKQVVVPDVVGQHQQAAHAQLSTTGLRVVVEQVASTVEQRNSVVGTEPAAGTSVPGGIVVMLRIGKGPDEATVPALPGHTVDDATQMLAARGLILGGQTEQETANADQIGKIISSTPTAEEKVPGGSVVAVVVGQQRSTRTVPDVIGRSANDAQRILEQVGFRVTRISVNGGTAGKVASLNPIAGSQATVGSTIKLSVSAGAVRSGGKSTSDTARSTRTGTGSGTSGTSTGSGTSAGSDTSVSDGRGDSGRSDSGRDSSDSSDSSDEGA